MARGRNNPISVKRESIAAIRDQLRAIQYDLDEALEVMDETEQEFVVVHYYPSALLGIDSLCRFAGQCRTQARFNASLARMDMSDSEFSVINRYAKLRGRGAGDKEDAENGAADGTATGGQKSGDAKKPHKAQ